MYTGIREATPLCVLAPPTRKLLITVERPVGELYGFVLVAGFATHRLPGDCPKVLQAEGRPQVGVVDRRLKITAV